MAHAIIEIVSAFLKKHDRLRRALLIIGGALFSFFLIFIALSLIFPLPLDKLERDYSTVFLDAEGRVMRITLSPSGKYRVKMPVSDMSPYLTKGFVAYEDARFYFHPGVDPLAIARAGIGNIGARRIVSGGSTITMQLARMIENRPRTMGAKIVEAFRALQLTVRYRKKEVLALYLNTVPMGGNIEGVGAAAYFYFGKDAKSLGVYEAGLLIGIPKNPNANRPDIDGARTHRIQTETLTRVKKKLNIDQRVIDRIPEGRAYFPRYTNPFVAPHYVETLMRRKGPFVRITSIDSAAQERSEAILKRHMNAHMRKGIYNAAVIVIDNKTLEPIVYIGSPDFSDRRYGRKINAARILRSPGSTLKPFIYARAIERGLITPLTALYDIPRFFGTYAPKNYGDATFGRISARNALIASLNIPAVDLEDRLQGEGARSIMRTALPSSRRKLIDRTGLAIAVGGVEVTLEESVALYAALANEGAYRPLRIDRNVPFEKPQTLIDPRAAYIVSEILSDYFRPDLPFAWEFSPSRAKAAFKTGTSFGSRDAWCIGYNKDYTAGVWLGNVDLTDSPALVGGEVATPLFIEIFNYLTRNSDAWRARPEGVARRTACAVSGAKANPVCPVTEEDWYIAGVSSEVPCETHKRIFVDTRAGYAKCGGCMHEEDSAFYEERVIARHSPLVTRYLRERSAGVSPLPPHDPACVEFRSGDAPVIMEPKTGSAFLIAKAIPYEEQRIALRVALGQDATRVYWFLNDAFIGEGSDTERVFLAPREGAFKITAVDEHGRSDSAIITIEEEREDTR